MLWTLLFAKISGTWCNSMAFICSHHAIFLSHTHTHTTNIHRLYFPFVCHRLPYTPYSFEIAMHSWSLRIFCFYDFPFIENWSILYLQIMLIFAAHSSSGIWLPFCSKHITKHIQFLCTPNCFVFVLWKLSMLHHCSDFDFVRKANKSTIFNFRNEMCTLNRNRQRIECAFNVVLLSAFYWICIDHRNDGWQSSYVNYRPGHRPTAELYLYCASQRCKRFASVPYDLFWFNV